MKLLLKILLILVAVIVLGVGIVYAWGGMIINREYSPQPRNVLLSSRPEIISRGERMGQVFGCYRGCHGEDMEGEIFFEGFWIGQIISPNLTRAMEEFSPAELEAMIRQGIKPDGTSVFGMPSASFSTMTDLDLSAILSFINQYPKQDLDMGRSRYGLLPQFMLVTGGFKPPAAESTGEPMQSNELQNPLVLGEYLAMNACSECHGMELEGNEGFAPPLAIARAYDEASFKKLLSTGLGTGDRDLGLMSVVSKYRFSKMTEQEMEALHLYLVSR